MKKDFTMLKDKECFTALSNVGFCTREQLINNIKGMSNKRIDNYLKAGYIKKEICNKRNENIISYKLTKEGKNYINKTFGIKHNYVPQNPHHDKALADKYFSLSNSERASWKNETVLKNEMKDLFKELSYTKGVYEYENKQTGEIEKYTGDELLQRYQEGEFSVVDCSYTSDSGVQVVYEVETNQYGKAEINAKLEYCNIINAEYSSVRIK